MSIESAIEIAIESLIVPSEGYAKRLPNGNCMAYPDPASGGDPWTIGYGSTGPDIKPGVVWTKEQAVSRLSGKVLYFLKLVLKMSPNLANAKDTKLAAVLSFVYNLGPGNYRASTFKRRIDAEDWVGAAEECLKWNKAKGRVLRGLTIRRNLESKFLLM